MAGPETIAERQRPRNELLFREVNERIREVSRHEPDDPLIILCECGRPECLDQIDIVSADYEAVRAHGSWFALVPGHVSPALEQVVARHRGYFVVDKTGGAGELAGRHDPRT